MNKNINNLLVSSGTPCFEYEDDDFILNDQGLFQKVYSPKEDRTKEVKISDPIKVIARLYNHETQFFNAAHTPDQQLLISFKIMSQNQVMEMAFERQWLNQPRQLINDLIGYGMYIGLSKKKWLIEFLNRQPVKKEMRYVSKPGWTLKLDAFVFPNKTYSWDKRITEDLKLIKPTNRFSHAGTADEWREHIVAPCIDDPLFLFSLAVAFTPVLLRLVNMDSFCVNLYGESSKGKTTALQIASSVWGCGSEPSEANSYIHNWNATGNALNYLATGSSDVLLAIDELGVFKEGSLGQVIYALSGGKSRKGMKANNQIRDDLTWNTVLLSSSEISGRQKMQESGSVYTGQLNRFIDIPVNTLNAESTLDARMVDELKTNCAQFYGSAGLELVDAITDYSVGKDDLIQKITWQHQQRYEALLAIDELKSVNITSELARSIKRFALIFTAADLISTGQILDLYGTPDNNKALEARKRTGAVLENVFKAWLKNLDLEPRSSADRMVSSIRNYLLANQARFVATDQKKLPRTIIGYFHKRKKLFLLTDDTFFKACKGFSVVESAKELKRQKLLHSQDAKRHKAKFNVESMEGKIAIHFYAISADILKEDA